jgi:hypothetical protein
MKHGYLPPADARAVLKALEECRKRASLQSKKEAKKERKSRASI